LAVLCIQSKNTSVFPWSKSIHKIWRNGNGKQKEIYDLIPENWIPKTIFASSESNFKEVLNSLKSQKLEFPVIVKPNIGLKGLGVVEVKNADELENYQK
jgi:glutathione synthase/RimK-type ligase-like ATP-grasp enzyme